MKKFILGVTAASLYASSVSFAGELEIPPTYEKCIGTINSAPIEALEAACEAAKTVAFSHGQPLAVEIEKVKKTGEPVAWYKKNALDHWMLYAASAAYHQEKWNAIRLGIKTDEACGVIKSAVAFFKSVSRELEPTNPFFAYRKQAKQFYGQCQKTPRNEPSDSFWGLSLSSMRQLVQVYEQDPKKRDGIEEFVAIKFKPSWDKSSISNGYKPLRENLAARYSVAKKGLTGTELTTLKRIYFGGLKRLDTYNHDQVPDFIYNWLEE